MKTTFLSFLLIGALIPSSFAQNSDSTQQWKATFSGYIDAYYCFDFAQPKNNERAGFWYNHKRHNEFNVNHGIIKTNVTSERVRGNIALMIGTYSQYNLIGEQELIRNIYEGNIGLKVSKKQNFWIDAGIFASHIGFESAISKDCWTLTRSILADNTPYYLAGAKATYTSANNQWIIMGIVANGWQRIKKLTDNSMPSFGTQIQYIPNNKITLNSSTYIGNEGADSLKQMRYFHNFYGIFTLSNKWSMIAGFDIGMQTNQMTKNTRKWTASAIMLRYQLSKKWKMCLRGEHYFDKEGIFITTTAPEGFKTFGYSCNFDYAPVENMLFRIEARGFSSAGKVLTLNNTPSKQNYLLATSMAVSF